VYSPHRNKIFGVPVGDNNYGKFVVFAQNHDHIGNRALGDRLTVNLSTDELKLAAALYILSPYVPLIFMGEEYGENAPFLYFTSHSDPELIKGVSEGRKKEFAYFNFKDDYPDPQHEETFEKSKLSWNIQEEDNASMLRYYKQLIQLRKSVKALQARNAHQ
jgi:maltooligosyltrehalose trehalohydrolase